MQANQMMRAAPALCLFTFAFSNSARAAPGQPTVLTNPAVNEPIQFDESLPLRAMASPPRAGAPEESNFVRRPKLQQIMNAAGLRRAAVVDGALQTSANAGVLAVPIVNVLGVGTGFGTYVVPDAPTDANLAVGDTQVVQWVNVSYAVFDKTTGAVLAGPLDGNNFWKGFGGSCEFANAGGEILGTEPQLNEISYLRALDAKLKPGAAPGAANGTPVTARVPAGIRIEVRPIKDMEVRLIP